MVPAGADRENGVTPQDLLPPAPYETFGTAIAETEMLADGC